MEGCCYRAIRSCESLRTLARIAIHPVYAFAIVVARVGVAVVDVEVTGGASKALDTQAREGVPIADASATVLAGARVASSPLCELADVSMQMGGALAGEGGAVVAADATVQTRLVVAMTAFRSASPALPIMRTPAFEACHQISTHSSVAAWSR